VVPHVSSAVGMRRATSRLPAHQQTAAL
jgi:hypothetical protein